MVNYSAAPMESQAWAFPDADLENPHFVITLEWSWPTQDYWSRFRLVRTLRSPAVRVEHGVQMFETTPDAYSSYNTDTGRPTYRDENPPAGEWTYYTAFVLNRNRVWKRAGYVVEIAIADYDWTLNLPEMLPGVAITTNHNVAEPADQSHDLVQFLQSPATMLDAAVTKAEALQFFWDPIKCPPQALPHLTESWGYPYSDLLGMARTRHVLDALRSPVQGSIKATHDIASAATGCEVSITISNNLMLDLNDSSFESGDINDTRWTSKTGLILLDYASTTDFPPVVPPQAENIKLAYFLYIPDARTIKCGTSNPVRDGVPIHTWEKVRMGMNARDYIESGTNLGSAISMGIDLHDMYGVFIQSVPVLTNQTLTTNWKWYGSADNSAVPITPSTVSILPATVLTSNANWSAVTTSGYSAPQSTVPTVSSGMRINWNTAPTTDTTKAFWGVASGKFATPINLGATYNVRMKVTAAVGAAVWRPNIPGYADDVAYVTPDGTALNASFDWVATTTTPSFGIEAQRPSGGWSTVGTHTVTEFEVIRTDIRPVYGVPWITTTNACYVDMICVDDGR